MADPITFDYDSAFSRNIGWVTQAEQARLRKSRIAIAGLRGVGGAQNLNRHADFFLCPLRRLTPLLQ